MAEFTALSAMTMVTGEAAGLARGELQGTRMSDQRANSMLLGTAVHSREALTTSHRTVVSPPSGTPFVFN